MNFTLLNGLNLLLYLADHPRPHSVSELSEAMGLPRSHVHRLLQTLLENRYIDKDDRRRYSIGVGSLRLGASLLREIPLRQRALPYMSTLARKHRLVVTLAQPFGDGAIAVAHASQDGSLGRSYASLGTVLSPHTSASGKLFLAYREPDDQSAVLSRLKFEPLGPNAHASADSLRSDLQEISRRGYSFNDREAAASICSLAVPLFSPAGKIMAALGVSGDPPRFKPDRLKLLVASLNRASDEITSSLPQLIESLS